MENLLYYGDNLDILRRYVKDETVDLIYLDPPFNSNQDYNVLFKEKDGASAASQIQAFGDTWTWGQDDEAVYAELVMAGGKVADMMKAFRTFLGPCDMLAYLVMMAPRLIELRRVLKSTGSIYLHCDPTASHYLKLLMDAVFARGFRSEVIWSYRRWPSKTPNFQHMHDVILYYSKGSAPTFNISYEPASDSFIKRFGGKGNRLERGETKKHATDKETPGMPMRDVWEISIIAGSAAERLGYPTQKPEALLDRIIRSSSNEGDVVLDPFCGCGTTISVAQRLNRRWIGIDITHLAMTLMKERLKDAFGDAAKFKVVGEPVSLPDAAALAAADPYQFQWWSLGQVGARPVEEKKGADKGIDGKIIFQGDAPGQFETVILSVKAGHVTVNQVRDLRGVLDREEAAIGVLISMEPPTKPMLTEAVTAGFYASGLWNRQYPKLQLLTVEELLAGKQIDMPPIRQVGATFKKAPKAAPKGAEQGDLPL